MLSFLCRLSVRLYRLLLLRYPSHLRGRFGVEMVKAFEAMLHEESRQSGILGVMRSWRRIAVDLLRPLPPSISVQGSKNDRRRHLSNGLPTTAGSLATGFREDMSFAVRSLTREPRFTGVVVGVLGVGIALNLAVFAVLNAYLIQPLPYPEADRLVTVNGWHSVSWTEVEDVFERAVSWDLDVFTVVGDGKPELLRGAWITPGFLEVYGVRAQLGRTFRMGEGGADGALVAMISHDLWRGRFEGDPAVVGRTIRAYTSDRPTEAELFTIVGVLPEDFWYLNEYTEILAPLRVERAVYAGLLRPDVPVERAEEVLTRIAMSRMDEVPPDFRIDVVPMQEAHVAEVKPTLLVLQAAVLLVLLIACANAGVLLLVRSDRREREMGVRRALGASVARLARQLLAEGLLLAGAAGAMGVGLATLGLGLAQGSLESRLGSPAPRGVEALALDGTVLTAALVLCIVVGVTFGMVPLIGSVKGGLFTTLSEGGRGGTDSRGRRRLRNGMVAAEVALSLALLTGAGLMVRSAVNLQQRELGFSPDGVVRGVVGLREASYPTASERIATFDRLVTQVGQLPGVAAVGLAGTGLFTTGFTPRRAEAEGESVSASALAVSWLVGEGYFETLGIEVVRGRNFSSADTEGAEQVAVVSESLAQDLWGARYPLGRAVRLPPQVAPGTTPSEPGTWLRVVGVVANVEREIGGPRAGDIYLTYRQAGPRWMNVMVRQHEGAPGLVPLMEDALWGIDPEIPLSSVLRLDDAVREAMAPTRYLAWTLAGFSSFALLLAVLGLYGVVSYAARQRRRDVAIRMALGATSASVTGLFLRQGLQVVAAGIAFGSAGGYLLGQALESRLHGVAPGDASTHLALAGLLGFTAIVAVWLPARRAGRTNPMGVLKGD